MNQDDVTILVADDDDGHAELIRANLVECGVQNPIERFKDGQAIWDFLNIQGPGPHREKNKSYLLLLDIRMPKMDGIEVLKNIKSNPDLKNMPVIILTTTDDPREIAECYSLGCNCYITKPVDFIKFTETLKRLGLFIIVVRVAKV